MNVLWIIAFLPHFVIPLLIVAGIAGLLVASFIGKVPLITQYNLPIKIVSLVLLVCGIYLQGASDYKAATDKAVSELKVKLARAEARSAKTNTEIVEKIVKDNQVIREKGETVIEYIDREVVKYDDACEIPTEVIHAHNAAATLNTGRLDGENK
jgi:energy-coupling factor transporter transmembrane protein EcfT